MPTTAHKITVAATITDPQGKEVFRSVHEVTDQTATTGPSLFTSLVHPMELILSDAHKQFALPPTEPADDQPATEATPSHE